MALPDNAKLHGNGRRLWFADSINQRRCIVDRRLRAVMFHDCISIQEIEPQRVFSRVYFIQQTVSKDYPVPEVQLTFEN